MIFRTRRTHGTGIEPQPVKQDAAPPQDKRIDSVLSELKSLREELSRSKQHQQEIESLKLQLAELQNVPERVPEPEPVTEEINQKAVDSSNSISKYLKSVLCTSDDYLTSNGYSTPDSKDEFSKTLKSFYSEYKEWCSDTNENIMKQSSVESYIRDGHVSGVRAVTVRGHKNIKIHKNFVIPSEDEE